MNWSEFTAELERIQRQFRIKSTKGIADLDAHHKQLSQSAADIFAAMRDEAQIDVDHGNGAGDLVRRQVRTIREYLSSLDRIADALTSVEGDRQDAYENTPTRDWYSRGARNMRDRKFNPNHDPANGRFTSGDGDSDGYAAGSAEEVSEAENDVDMAVRQGNGAFLRSLRQRLETQFAYYDDGPANQVERIDRIFQRIDHALEGGDGPPPVPSGDEASRMRRERFGDKSQAEPPGAHKAYNGR